MSDMQDLLAKIPSVEDLAERAAHIGLPVRKVVRSRTASAGDRRDGRVLLENGLSLRAWVEGIAVDYYHGEDPLTGYSLTSFGTSPNMLALPRLVASAEDWLPTFRASLRGENRDIAAQVRSRFAELTYEAPADVRLNVVASEEPVAGSLAVSMRGLIFAAWYDGVKYPCLFPLTFYGFQRREPTYDIAGDGYDLTVAPHGLHSARVHGVLAVGTRESWVSGSLDVRRGAAYWRDSLGASESVDVSDEIEPSEASAASVEMARAVAASYPREFSLYADAEVEHREHHLRNARNAWRDAGTTGERIVRFESVQKHERDLEYAQRVRDAGFGRAVPYGDLSTQERQSPDHPHTRLEVVRGGRAEEREL